jgi:hypothetical protein
MAVVLFKPRQRQSSGLLNASLNPSNQIFNLMVSWICTELLLFVVAEELAKILKKA